MVQQLMAQLYVFSRCVEVQDQVFAGHHRVQVQAGDVLFHLFLLDVGSLVSHHLGLEVQSALGLQEGGVDGQMDLVGGGGLVAIEEGSESAFLFRPFAHLGDENDLAPQVNERILDLGRSVQDEVQVHLLLSENLI